MTLVDFFVGWGIWSNWRFNADFWFLVGLSGFETDIFGEVHKVWLFISAVTGATKLGISISLTD